MAKKKTLSKYQTKHIEYVKNKLAKAVMNYEMIADGDKVLVAVSGGKDSLVLLEALAAFQKFKLVSFELEAIHINVKDVAYVVDRDFLFSFAKSLGITMNIVDIEADLENRDKKSPCFVCSWHRRKKLFTFANENGFNRLALGHHMDDAVETLLINMTYHANISSMPGKLKMFKGELDLIRPLILLTNKDTKEFSNIRQYPKLKAECPFEDKTRRTTARRLITELEAINKNAKRNLFNSLSNIDREYLP